MTHSSPVNAGLLPCPFCDGTDSVHNACQMAKVVTRQFKSAIGVPAYRVECACGTQGPAKLDWLEAESAWNGRSRIRAQCVPSRIDKGRAFYLAMYEKDGAIWAANDHKGLWCDMAEDYERRISALTSPEHQSAPAYAATHNSGEGDPSVMPDYAGADTAIQPQCAPDREALVRAIQLSYARKDLEPTSATTLALYREDAENAADAVLALTRPTSGRP